MKEKPLMKASGALWIISVASVFAALVISLVYDITLMDREIDTTLINVAANQGAHIVELMLDVASSVAIILAAVTMFLAFHKQHTTWAAMGSALLAVGGTILVVHDMGNFALTWVAREYVTAPEANQVALESLGRAMVITAKWGVTLGAINIVLGVMAYAVVLYMGGLSKLLGALGLASSVLALIATAPAWINPQWEQLGYTLFFPFMIWEIALGVWLMSNKQRF